MVLVKNIYLFIKIIIVKDCRSFEIAWHTTIGLCDVGEFEILPPGTAAQLKN
jgi:hypothetical protein